MNTRGTHRRTFPLLYQHHHHHNSSSSNQSISMASHPDDDAGDDYLARHQRAKHELLLVMLQCERDRFQRIERELAVLILSIDTRRDDAMDAWHTMTVHNRPNIARDRLIDFPPMPRILRSNSDDDRDTSRSLPSMMQCHTAKKKTTSAREQRNCVSKRPVVQQQRHVKRQLCGQTNRRMRHDNHAKRK
jgi:hypothetical protein